MDVCRQFVEDQLKSPSSAEFSEETASGGTTTWTVRGSVDSQNGFGAMIRNTYTCTVEYAGDEQWTLTDLQFPG